MYRPTMSRTLSMKRGSVESLNVSSTQGFRPKAFQIRLTVGCDIPRRGVSPSITKAGIMDGFMPGGPPTHVRTKRAGQPRGRPCRLYPQCLRPARRAMLEALQSLWAGIFTVDEVRSPQYFVVPPLPRSLAMP